MGAHLPLLLSVLMAFVLWGCANAQPQPEAAAQAPIQLDKTQAQAKGAGYNAKLDGYDYPFNVEYLSLESQGQQLKLAYMVQGPSAQDAKGTVLLLHGKNFSGAYWEETIKALVAQGMRVIVPDQIGFGKSSKPTQYQYTFQQMALQTKALLDKLGADKVSVVGHSMGGMLATRFALMFPEQTKQLVLVNPIGLEDWKRVVPYRSVDHWYQAELKKTPEGVKAYMQKAYFADQWDERYDPLLPIQAGWSIGPDRETIAKVSALTYDMIFTQPVLYEFGDVKAPTLLIIGQRDKTALGKQDASPEVAPTLGDYPKLGRAAQAAIPGSKLVEMDNIGHVPQFERFDEYIKALNDFIVQGWSAAP